MNKKRFVLSRLAGISLLIYVAGGGASSYFAYRMIADSLLQQHERNLEAVLNSRAALVEDYFHTRQQQVSQLAESEMIVSATRAFTNGFGRLENDFRSLAPIDNIALDAELTAFYADEFKPTSHGPEAVEATDAAAAASAARAVRSGDTARTGDIATSAQPLLPHSATSRIAQWLYLANNPSPLGQRNEMYESAVASSYESAHRSFHPKLNHFLKSFDFRDVFLFDMSGNLIYSTQKETDFATNFKTGPYAQSGLGRVYRGALAGDVRTVVTADFEKYAPSHQEPAAFLASPVFGRGERIGVVAFQLASDKLNSVMADFSGLGGSGETYIVGNDGLMRTDSRFAEQTTILNQSVDTVAAKESLKGRTGTAIIDDYRGVSVLSRYQPLNITGLHWGIIGEVDRSELMAPATTLARRMVLVFAAALGLIALVTFVTLRLCVIRPLRQLTASADRIIDGDYTARVDVASEDEFSILAESHNRMASAVQQHVGDLERSLSEVKELQGLLPICAACKSIRDSDGYFRTVETYLVGKSKVEFSHTICEDCVPRLYPELGELSRGSG